LVFVGTALLLADLFFCLFGWFFFQILLLLIFERHTRAVFGFCSFKLPTQAP